MQNSFDEEFPGESLRLRLSGISKYFPGVRALDNVNFDLRFGEVHAICGENGAGKTTLMNLLSGNLQPDFGEVLLNGEKVRIHSPEEAQTMGIGIVYQEKSLIPGLTVADNIFAGNQPVTRFGLIDRKKLAQQTNSLLSQLGLQDIEAGEKLNRLSSGKQQMVEIAKALSRNPDVLILDEPTATISEQDARLLFNIIGNMISEGKSVIYISHRLSELFEIADRVTVLKDGKYQGTLDIDKTNIDEIIRLMVGRDIKVFDYVNRSEKKTRLSVRKLSGKQFSDVSFDLKEGEVLGFSGLVGSGRTEVARTLFGVDRLSSGDVSLDGSRISVDSTRDAIARGIYYLPESRKDLGLFLDMDIHDNLLCAILNTRKKVDEAKRLALVQDFIDKLNIKTPNLHEKIKNLSGGNQQKVILARWLLLKPKVLIVDEPTAGIDVGTKSEIYLLLNNLTKDGTSIIFISSDLQELLGICDRLLVFCNGTITARLSRNQFSEEEIMHYSSGTKTQYPNLKSA